MRWLFSLLDSELLYITHELTETEIIIHVQPNQNHTICPIVERIQRKFILNTSANFIICLFRVYRPKFTYITRNISASIQLVQKKPLHIFQVCVGTGPSV